MHQVFRSQALMFPVIIARGALGCGDDGPFSDTESPVFDLLLVSDWAPYTRDRAVTIGGGSKVLFAEGKDSSGNMSSVVSATVVLAEPITIVGLSPYIAGTSPDSRELWIANVSNVARMTFTPKQPLSADVAVELVEGEWTALYEVQEGDPPVIISDVMHIDGEIVP